MIQRKKLTIPWFVAGVLCLGFFVFLLVTGNPQHDAGGGPESARSAVNKKVAPRGSAPVSPEFPLATADSGSGEREVARRLAQDPPEPPDTRDENLPEAVDTDYLAADTTGADRYASEADTRTINVGGYIDPEGFVAESDNTPVQIGEYLDPDAGISAD